MKTSPGNPVPTIMELLRQDSAAADLLPTAERLMLLQQDLNLLLPAGTANACTIHIGTEHTLFINAASAALAGKLRQTVPSLIAGLSRRGWKVNAIQLRVQPTNNHLNSMNYINSSGRAKHARLSETALGSWTELAENLDASPLREAVTKLLQHQTSTAKNR